MNDFTASNGVTIEREGEAIGFDCSGDGDRHHIGISETSALREFFQVEADERLGRWRSKFHPEFFVVWAYEGETIHVCSDRFPAVGSALGVQDRNSSEEGDTVEHEVAREFFDAHPEPKPWHNAQPGEVWELAFSHEGGGGIEPFTVDRVGKFWHPNYAGGVSLADSEITAGRRIWPEAVKS